MAGSGSINPVPVNYSTIDIYYSVNVTGTGRQAVIDVINDPGRTYFKRIELGAGFHEGVYSLGGLQPNTRYRFGLYDFKNQSDYVQLDMKWATTPAYEPPPGEPPPDTPPYIPPPPTTPSGTLSAAATGANTARINYTYANGTNVSLFRGAVLLQTFGSGAGSGVYEDSGLDPETQYTYYLRNGATVGSTLLALAIINTPELPAEGTLSKQVVDSNTVDLTYSFHDGTNVSLFRYETKITTFGSGAGSGTYRNTGLEADTSYTYYLRNGMAVSDLLLAQSTAKTLLEARKSIVKQGKILPLTSQLTIFDSTVKPLGLIENYEYLYWNFKYRNFGNFELKINRYKPNVQYLQKGNIVALYVAGYYRAGVIEYINIGLTGEGKKSENYKITGRDLGGIFAERDAEHNVSTGTGYDSQNTVASTAMRHYVNVNCMNSSNTDKNYPLLFLENPDPQCGGNIKYDARFQTIAELCEEICLASGLGWEVILDPTNRRFIFRNIEGLDRSFGNGDGNKPVTFSPEFENIKLINYTDSNINSKNVATVAGQGEGADRLIVEVSKDGLTYTGMDRREIFIDARDLASPAVAYTNDPSVGNNIELNMADTSEFTVGDIVIVSSSAGSERATITIVDTNVHITVNTLALNHTTTNPLVTNITKLIQRGNERLVELGETKAIEMDNLSTGPFKFGEDFYMGDIVTAEYPKIVSANVRVIEAVIEIDAGNLIQNSLILGKPFPNSLNITDLRNKNILPEVRR